MQCEPLDRSAVGSLLRIPHGRVSDPLLFGNISIEQGFTFVRDKAQVLVAYEGSQNPVGTIGFQFDETNRLIKGVELIAKNDDVWASLGSAFVQAGDELAEVLTVDVSASINLGFRGCSSAMGFVRWRMRQRWSSMAPSGWT